jgi:hypothetical protein
MQVLNRRRRHRSRLSAEERLYSFTDLILLIAAVMLLGSCCCSVFGFF